MKHLSSYNLSETTYKSGVWFKLYHGSQKEFKPGFMLEPQSDGYTSLDSEKEIEDLFEKHRPKDKISRKSCVFLADDIDLIDPAGGYTDYIYDVIPKGNVDKSDLAWYTDVFLHMEDDYDEKDLLPMIRNYWSGKEYKNKGNSLFEYRAKSAKIISVL